MLLLARDFFDSYSFFNSHGNKQFAMWRDLKTLAKKQTKCN